MANIKIAQLTNKTTLADTDLVIVESATQTMKMTIANFKELIGAGIESGSNSYGSYVKFPDGTMIQYMNIVPNRGITETYQEFPFPINFHPDFPPTISITHAYGANSGYNACNNTLGISATINLLRIQVFNATTVGVTLPAKVTAIGRWK